jgi:hypothetical protein
MILVGGILILALALGVSVVFAQVDQDPDTPPETLETPPFHAWGKGGHGITGQVEGLTPFNELIADELGLSAEDLEGAYAAAFEAAREDGAFGFRGHRGFGDKGEFESYLEDALAEIGVTIEELETAKETANATRLDELYDAGYLSDEQLSLIQAKQALKDYIDHEAMMAEAAEALGIELPDAETALEEGIDPRALMEQLEEQGITIQDVMEAVQAAYESAINQAVVDGIIDEDQAELILSDGFDGIRGHGGLQRFGGVHGFGGMRGFGGMHGSGESRGFGGHDFGGMRGFHEGGGYRGFCPEHEDADPTSVSL